MTCDFWAENAKKNTAAKTTAIDSFENHESVQVALSVVINALATGNLDIKRAPALLYGLQLASNNACGFHTEPYAANTVEPSNPHPKSQTSPNPEPPLTPTTSTTSPTTKKTKDSPKNKPHRSPEMFSATPSSNQPHQHNNSNSETGDIREDL